MTVNGELDGLHRVSRVAESFYNLFDRKAISIDASSVKQNPVVVLKGQNHLQFANGTNPPFVVKRLDLKADVSNQDAQLATSAVVVDFLCMHHENGGCDARESSKRMAARVKDTRKFLDPMIQAFKMEGNLNIKKKL